MDLSIIIPIFNEADSIGPLHREICDALASLPLETEIIYVNDGSHDGSDQVLDRLAAEDRRIVVIHFRRNFGQTAALQAGFEQACGRILVTLDGDLQNDPHDIKEMLQLLEQGADLVHGWRKGRQDRLLTRKLPSWIANRLISRITGLPIHDLGCTLKAMLSEVAQELDLYGEMHRFIPVLAYARGARCREMVVTHHPRRFGTSKYGLNRTTRVLLDLITVKFLIDYLDRPMKLLGRLAMHSFVLSVVCGISVLVMKLWGRIDMTGNPLLLMTVFMSIVSLQFLGLGLLGEMNTRLYYQRSHRRPFSIRRTTLGSEASRPVREAA